MFDPLTSKYSFPCPLGREVRVPLSAFRRLVRLPGTAHPAVYDVRFACRCGDEHRGLVSHDDLDWVHLGSTADLTFRNFMTARDDPLGVELLELASGRIGAGEWPWSFYCYPEARPRPVTPSAFAAIAPGGPALGIAVECPVCASVSVNLVTRAHVDIPFWNDDRIGVVEHVFGRDAERLLDDFRSELRSAHFGERRLDLEL